MKRFLLSLALLCACILQSCGDGPTESAKHGIAIYGRVQDKSGRPVANAEIGLVFDMLQTDAKDTSVHDPALTTPFPSPARSSTGYVQYSYTLDEAEWIKIVLLNSAMDTIYTNEAGYALPGKYSSYIRIQEEMTDRLQRNGIYYLVLKKAKSVHRQTIFYNIPEGPAWTKSNSDGGFVIRYDQLPIGLYIPRINEIGTKLGMLQVGDSVSVIVNPALSEPQRRKLRVKVDPAKAAELTIQL